MIAVITQLVIGYAVICAAVLLVCYLFFLRDMQKSAFSKLSCAALLAALTGLQLLHWQFLQDGADLFASTLYVFLLIATPPMFYFFSREVLLPETQVRLSDAVHLLPLALVFVMPNDLVTPVALTIGVGYSIWLVNVVFGLRRHVRRFKFELFFFGFFALFAIAVLVLALADDYLAPSVFHIAYANITGLALILIATALIGFPEILSDISAAARLAYSASTLKQVNVAEKLAALDRLMVEDKLFQNENLNLTAVAEALCLSPHQVSEMVNGQFGYGYSRYIREQRIEEAKRLLRADDTSSILSISLMTGFKSQSNFYAAFREIAGESPGAYRKKS